jgi:hypothetical protein
MQNPDYQRTDYKKTTAPKPAQAKKQTIVTTGPMGKALNSNSMDILHMGKKAK